MGLHIPTDADPTSSQLQPGLIAPVSTLNPTEIVLLKQPPLNTASPSKGKEKMLASFPQHAQPHLF